MTTYSLCIFSRTSVFFFSLIGAVSFLPVCLVAAHTGWTLSWPLTISIVVLISAGVLIFSCRKASLSIKGETLLYTTCLLRVRFERKTLQSVAVVPAEQLPGLFCKLWAYSFGDEKTGLFYLDNNKKAYISGTSARYLHVQAEGKQLFFALAADCSDCEELVRELENWLPRDRGLPQVFSSEIPPA